ncbi:hypothetical protein D9M69_535610 [compost metagenome]
MAAIGGDELRGQLLAQLDAGQVEPGIGLLARIADDDFETQGAGEFRTDHRNRRDAGDDQARCWADANLQRAPAR